ncbi:hypothetical protein COOONC_05091 [Cooperia oncophora]
MSTVPEQDESMQKIILPEPCIHEDTNGVPSTSRRRSLDHITAKRTMSGDRAQPTVTTTSNGTCFGLFDNEEEERLLGDSEKPLPFIDDSARLKAGQSPIGARHASTAPSLRSISLPKGSSPQSSSELTHSASVAAVHPPHAGSPHGKIPLTQSELRKPKKEVSQYYKKQNELLENFKNDSVSKSSNAATVDIVYKYRGRSANKDDGEDLNRNLSQKGSKVSNNNLSTSDTMAPLLKNTDGEQDVEIGNVAPNQPLVDRGDDRKSSIASDISVLARHEANMDAARATSKAASRLAHATLIVNISLMVAKIIISVVMGVASVQLIFGAISRIAAAYKFNAYGEYYYLDD